MGVQTYTDFARDSTTRAIRITESPTLNYYASEAVVAADPDAIPTAFVVAGTGWEYNLDVNAWLGHNASNGYVACDGAGSIVVATSSDDSTDLGTAFTVKPGEVASLEGLSVDSIEINAAADMASTYRVRVW